MRSRRKEERARAEVRGSDETEDGGRTWRGCRGATKEEDQKREEREGVTKVEGERLRG